VILFGSHVSTGLRNPFAATIRKSHNSAPSVEKFCLPVIESFPFSQTFFGVCLNTVKVITCAEEFAMPWPRYVPGAVFTLCTGVFT